MAKAKTPYTVKRFLTTPRSDRSPIHQSCLKRVRLCFLLALLAMVICACGAVTKDIFIFIMGLLLAVAMGVLMGSSYSLWKLDEELFVSGAQINQQAQDLAIRARVERERLVARYLVEALHQRLEAPPGEPQSR